MNSYSKMTIMDTCDVSVVCVKDTLVLLSDCTDFCQQEQNNERMENWSSEVQGEKCGSSVMVTLT